ncbi:hypothetical protein EYF80_027054 [Liparis tanakae]|uniref:Uncharacterized protein n=1 Tax=Liparis tanakae TaxID=230148 RepID=A0A4Z2HD51_9TELE|nr:hypothetical protein EYF80_027054 [Liparis tanakae]
MKETVMEHFSNPTTDPETQFYKLVGILHSAPVNPIHIDSPESEAEAFIWPEHISPVDRNIGILRIINLGPRQYRSVCTSARPTG